MESLNSVSSIVFDTLARLYNGIHFDVGLLLPARIDQFVDGSRAGANIRGVLSQISFALSLVFVAILVVTRLKKQALKSAGVVAAVSLSDQAAAGASTPMSGAMSGKWNEILTHLDSPRENDWKSAVMNADKLVDTALAQSGFSGETFGDRLTNIDPGTLTSLDGLWWAHKVRNRLAHEVDYFLRYTEAKAAISYYEATLVELKLI